MYQCKVELGNVYRRLAAIRTRRSTSCVNGVQGVILPSTIWFGIEESSPMNFGTLRLYELLMTRSRLDRARAL